MKPLAACSRAGFLVVKEACSHSQRSQTSLLLKHYVPLATISLEDAFHLHLEPASRGCHWFSCYLLSRAWISYSRPETYGCHECLFSELSTLGMHSRHQLGLTWDQGDSVVTVTLGSFSSYQSLNLCGAGCTKHVVPVCFVRLCVCLSRAPVYLWGSLMSIWRCFGPLCHWCQPRSVSRRSTGHCHACAHCLFSSSSPSGGVGRGRIKIAAYCSAPRMDTWGLKLCSATKFSH